MQSEDFHAAISAVSPAERHGCSPGEAWAECVESSGGWQLLEDWLAVVFTRTIIRERARLVDGTDSSTSTYRGAMESLSGEVGMQRTTFQTTVAGKRQIRITEFRRACASEQLGSILRQGLPRRVLLCADLAGIADELDQIARTAREIRGLPLKRGPVLPIRTSRDFRGTGVEGTQMDDVEARVQSSVDALRSAAQEVSALLAELPEDLRPAGLPDMRTVLRGLRPPATYRSGPIRELMADGHVWTNTQLREALERRGIRTDALQVGRAVGYLRQHDVVVKRGWGAHQLADATPKEPITR